MSDRLDSRIRELAYRLLYMAPEAPPFPEESMTTLKTPSRGPRRPVLVWAAAMVGALVLVGVPLFLLRTSDSAGPATTVPPASSTTTADTTTTTVPVGVVAFTEFNVYFFSEDVEGPNGDAGLVAVRRTREHTEPVEDPVRAALFDALTSLVIDGPGDSGLYSSIPEGIGAVGVGVENGIVTVDLPAAFESGGGSAMMMSRLAQVVFTATQFPEFDAMQFSIDGQIVDVITSEGIMVDGPQTRTAYLDQLPQIFVDIPAIGAAVGSPVTIGGIANVFEATVSYEVTTASGEVLASGFTNASCGTGCWGDYSVEVPYTLETETPGFVTVFADSAQDGSRINVVSYPVTLEPGEGGEPPAAAPEVVHVEGVVPGETVADADVNVTVTALGIAEATIGGVQAEVVEAEPIDGVPSYSASADLTLVEGVNPIEIVLTGPGGVTTDTIEVTYQPELERQIAYLTQVGSGEIVADYLQFLTGDEAAQAAFEDGVIASVEEGVPNDYYIRNQNDLLRTLPVADDVLVMLLTSADGPIETVEVPMEEWLALFKPDGTPWDSQVDEVPSWDEPPYGYYGASLASTPYWLTLDPDGTVIQIEQQYLP